MDPDALRADIPAVDGLVYLNTGASGPSPRRVVEAAATELERHAYDAPGGEGPYPYAFDGFDETRAAVASHVGVDAADVALTQSTADGIARVAGALDWGEGDAVVRTDAEHPAGVLPWERLREARGVEVRTVPTDRGRVDRDAYREAVRGARLVCLSAVTWTTGARLPVAELVAEARDAGARTLVDAVQVPGQLPIDARGWGADFVAAAGHKWLLAPWGAGFLYVAPEAAADLSPVQVGYMSVDEPDAAVPALRAGARRLELGTASPAPYAGLREALSLVEEIGYDAIRSRIERLTDRLKDGLGDRLVGPRGYESGLVAFDAAGEDPAAAVERLRREGIVVRDLPTGDLRASVHAFNTESDVDALLTAL